MANVKKLSVDQFYKDVINFMLKKHGVDYDYIINLPKEPQNKEEIDPNVEYQDKWYTRYTFATYEEYDAYRQYFYEHFKLWQPQYRWKRYYVDNCFAWFDLEFGLKIDFDFDELIKRKKEDDMYWRVFGKTVRKDRLQKKLQKQQMLDQKQTKNDNETKPELSTEDSSI